MASAFRTDKHPETETSSGCGDSHVVLRDGRAGLAALREDVGVVLSDGCIKGDQRNMQPQLFETGPAANCGPGITRKPYTRE